MVHIICKNPVVMMSVTCCNICLSKARLNFVFTGALSLYFLCLPTQTPEISSQLSVTYDIQQSIAFNIVAYSPHVGCDEIQKPATDLDAQL
jgi:hypothetical protein